MAQNENPELDPQQQQRGQQLLKEFSKHRKKLSRGAKIGALAVVLGLGILFCATLLDSWFDHPQSNQVAPSTATAANTFAGPEFFKNITQIDPPAQASVFGERIPLDNWEIRERFEREFYYNFVNADQLVLWYKRSKRWFPYIDQALRDANMPADLKYLAVAESGLRNVKSPAGANGFWQFIAPTAQRYGLRIDDAIDERLDPRKETQAAVKYLQKMKAEFPKWTLVAAAYNMGEDGLHQVLDYQHQTSYWNIYLNEETMRYVLRIAAIKELLEHGDHYGLDLGRLHTFHIPQVRTVTVQGPVAAIADWAVSQNSSYKDVKTLNPWIIGRSLPAGTYQIDLPATNEDKTTVTE